MIDTLNPGWQLTISIITLKCYQQADRPRYARLTTCTRAYGPRLYLNIKLYVNSPHSLVHLLQIHLIVSKNTPTVIISMG